MKKITKILAASSAVLPFMAFADAPDLNWFTVAIEQIGGVITSLIPLLIAIALLVFIWGVVKFISAADDSARDDGKKKMIWGIVGLFVIISVWGLVALLSTLVGVGDSAAPESLPTVPLV